MLWKYVMDHSGLAPPAFMFIVLFYWTYWLEHALLWGDPRFGLAVYPVLVAMAAPIARCGRITHSTAR